MRGPWAPRAGVSHPLVLYGQSPLRLLSGTLISLVLMLLLPSLVAASVLLVASMLREPVAASSYISDALDYHFPEGVLAAHLGLASLILIAVLLMRYLHQSSFVWTLSVQPGMRWRHLIICFLMAAVVLNLILWVGPESGNLDWQEAQPQWYAYLAIIVLTAPLQAAAEEIFFRGYLQQAIGSATGQQWVGVLVSSLIFAVMHGFQNPPLFVHRFGFGLIAGALVILTGGLEAAIAVHAVNNLMAFGYAVVTGGVAAVAATQAISWTSATTALAGFLLCSALAWWIGRRMNLATRTP